MKLMDQARLATIPTAGCLEFGPALAGMLWPKQGGARRLRQFDTWHQLRSQRIQTPGDKPVRGQEPNGSMIVYRYHYLPSRITEWRPWSPESPC